MPNFATLGTLRTRVRQAADMITGQAAQFCSDPEINGYINDSYSELHDLLILRFQDYARTITTFPLASAQELYQLPDDFHKVVTVWLLLAPGQRIELLPFMPGEEQANYQNITPGGNSTSYRYAIEDNFIRFAPLPSAGPTIELRYIPQYKKMYNDADTISVTVVNGWEEYIVVDAAIKCRDRATMDNSRLDIRKARLEHRIVTAASGRDAGHAKRVRDTGRIF